MNSLQNLLVRGQSDFTRYLISFSPQHFLDKRDKRAEHANERSSTQITSPKITKHFSSAFFDGRRTSLTISEKNVSSLSTDVDHQEFFHSWTETVKIFS